MGNTPSPLRKSTRWAETDNVRKILDRAGDRAAKLINEDHTPDCILDSCSRVEGNAFYYAVSKNRIIIMRIMLEKGADPYATGVCGETCLHCAARNNYMEAAKVLMDCKVDPRTTDDRGRYPVHSAGMALFNTSEMIRYLLEDVGKKEDVNLRDFREKTPLHHAAIYGNEQVVKTLISYGAEVNSIDKSGSTPLHYAHQRHGVWSILIEKGADQNITNNEGHKPGEKS